MPKVDSKRNTIIIEKPVKQEILCYHCGADCITDSIKIEDKFFCCEGCKLVYKILNENGLCDYYKLQNHPGLSQIKPIRNDKYSYLDNEDIAKQLYKFTDGKQIMVTFYIPGVHCTSCMWLLEHLHKLNTGVIESRLNFTTKEVTIRFAKEQISLRKVVELLTTIGYEPYISLDDGSQRKTKSYNRQRIYKLGVAGFCFGNIMMMSFPEYLSNHTGIEQQYAHLFRFLNLGLSVPVFFYSASEFFVSAWKGLRQKILNIDAPIALALVITYLRSIYEILSNTGGGYLDSMSGIVFFMLVGRIVQERTYKSISFNRDYKSYFPIAVTVLTGKGSESKGLQDLKEKDIVLLHNDEIVPADALVVSGKGSIDYSFVTGESEPVLVNAGEMVYAGGRQVGEQVTLQILKPVAGSYLTSLWNHYAFSKNKAEVNAEKSVVHVLSRYFTYILFILAAITAVYWAMHDAAKVLPAVSAMLIVACPCALLLSATYTNGNLLRIFSDNGLFLRDASVIEQLGKVDSIVFDKTGTLTQGAGHVQSTGHQLSADERSLLYSVVSSSKHPYSKALMTYLGACSKVELDSWKEIAGMGIEAYAGGVKILVGSARFVGLAVNEHEKAALYTSIDNKITAFYLVHDLRDSIPTVISELETDFQLSLLSGDNDRQKKVFREVFGNKSELLFEQKPADKLQYIEKLQQKGQQVLMIGDGLNDAGALQQSNVGITLAEDINNFTPSCDAILDAKKIKLLPNLIKLSQSAKLIVGFSFVISILYNIVGLYISVQGKMQPMIAAILMPISTLSIVLITTGLSSVIAKYYHFSLRPQD